VFQESAHNADDSNIFAQISDLWTQATDTAYDQIDFRAGTGSLVEFLDNLLINERIKLHNHATGPPGGSMISLAFDHSDESFLQIEWRNQEFFQAGITGQAGKRIEDGGDFLGDFWI